MTRNKAKCKLILEDKTDEILWQLYLLLSMIQKSPYRRKYLLLGIIKNIQEEIKFFKEGLYEDD